jgi:methionine-rich copper-binding protein CopC
MRRITAAVPAAVLIGVALALTAPLSASAHDSLASSDPAADAGVTTALSDVTLTFSGTPLNLGEGQRSNAVEVRHDGRNYETDCVALSDKNVTVPVALGGAGAYEVVWQVVSSDGHPVSGSYSFDYTPPAGTDQAEGSPTPACAATAASSGGAAAAGASDDTILITAAAGIGALAIVGVVVAILFGRRRSLPLPDDGSPGAPSGRPE